MEKSIKEFTRYRFNTISYILTFYVLFISMFFGLKYFGASMSVSSENLGNTLEGLVVGFFLWTIMVMTYADTAYSITHDATTGTLEQVSMSYLGLENILVTRSITNLITNLIICIVTILGIMLTTGIRLEINVLSLFIPIFIGIFSILGIGLIFGGIALIFKKVQSLLDLIQYFLIALVIPGVESLSKVVEFLLPFRPSIEKIFLVSRNGQTLSDFSLLDYSMMIGNSIIYFSIGIYVFKICTKIAKKKGVLGQY